MAIKFLPAAALLLLAGCAVGPNFQRPNPWSPASWFKARPTPARGEASLPVAEPVDAEWWTAFRDPVLTGLVRRVAAGNLDVRAAAFRLAQSRAQRSVTAADQFAQVNGNASYTRQRISRQGVFSEFGSGGGSGGSGSGASSPGAQSNGLGGQQGGFPTGGTAIPPFDLFQGGFDASWELDLWGRVRRAVESADATLEASAEAQRAQLLSSIAEVARDYMQLRGTQDTLRITRDNLAAAGESVRLTTERARGGLATDLDVANARAQLEATAATVPQLEQQEAQGINAIGLLLGMAPAALRAELSPRKPVPPVPPRVPVGLPSELARRRPDIRQAEAQLHAATADIGAAQADFYPRLTLSGSVALQATQIKNLGFSAGTYSFGPSLTVPIFEGGRLRGTLRLREAQQQEAAVNYQRTVLQAFTEVDNALIAHAAEQRRHLRLAEQVAQSRRAFNLAQNQYRQGVTDFLQVLTAQRTVLAAEQQLSDSTATVSANLVALYKALGGGWEADLPTNGPAPKP